jgi:hypothetical protein
MECMTESEMDEWLLVRSLPKDPYHQKIGPDYYVQFLAPSNDPRLGTFIRHYFASFVCEAESLIQMTDWSLYQPGEMIAIDAIRSSQGESRLLIDAPGHHLAAEEFELGIELFSLSASFGWSSCLYAPATRSVLFNWEGEIFDFWTESEAKLLEMEGIKKQYGLRDTNC